MADKGSKRILHCEVLKIKEMAHDGPASSDKKIVIKYETKDYKGDDTNGKETFYNGKYNHKMFKELKATLDELLEGNEDEFTLYQTKGEEYWDTDDIKVGLEGTHGLQVTGGVQGGSAGSGGGGGGSYDNVGAKVGMLMNNAVLILTSSGNEVTEASLMKTANFLDGVVEKFKASLTGKTPTPAVEDDDDDEDEEEAPAQPKKKASKPKKKAKVDVEEDDSDPFGG